MLLESTLIERLIVEAAKFRGQPTEGPDQLDLCGDEVHNEAEARSPGKLETFLGFRLHLGKRISHRQKVRDQLVPAISGKCQVTDPVGGIEGATYQIPSAQGMFRRRHDEISERHVCSSLITR